MLVAVGAVPTDRSLIVSVLVNLDHRVPCSDNVRLAVSVYVDQYLVRKCLVPNSPDR